MCTVQSAVQIWKQESTHQHLSFTALTSPKWEQDWRNRSGSQCTKIDNLLFWDFKSWIMCYNQFIDQIILGKDLLGIHYSKIFVRFYSSGLLQRPQAEIMHCKCTSPLRHSRKALKRGRLVRPMIHSELRHIPVGVGSFQALASLKCFVVFSSL